MKKLTQSRFGGNNLIRIDNTLQWIKKINYNSSVSLWHQSNPIQCKIKKTESRHALDMVYMNFINGTSLECTKEVKMSFREKGTQDWVLLSIKKFQDILEKNPDIFYEVKTCNDVKVLPKLDETSNAFTLGSLFKKYNGFNAKIPNETLDREYNYLVNSGIKEILNCGWSDSDIASFLHGYMGESQQITVIDIYQVNTIQYIAHNVGYSTTINREFIRNDMVDSFKFKTYTINFSTQYSPIFVESIIQNKNRKMQYAITPTNSLNDTFNVGLYEVTI